MRNALLYKTAGTKIRIVLRRNASWAEVLIQDDGVPDEAIPKLFEMFYRVGSQPERNPKGTGFGLAIAKRIVDPHGGTVSAAHAQPHGLSIRIRLLRVLS